MTEYLVRRALVTVPLLVVVLTAVFLLVHLIPGDPVDFMIGENAALDRKTALRRAYHLDKPILVSTRPWFDRDDAARLLDRTGDLRVGNLVEPSQRKARQRLEDLGRWAIVPLFGLWQDESASPALRQRARRALPIAIRHSGRADDATLAVLHNMLAYARPGLGARRRVGQWIEAHRAWLAPGRRGRLAATVSETQYALFLRDIARGELRSLHSRKPVVRVLARKFGHTLMLAGTALVVAMLVAIPLGTLAARHPYSWIDNGSMLAALFGISMPNFWLGPLLILVFSIELGWFPVSGAVRPSSIVLPSVTLGLGMSAILCRITRASVLETIGSDYVRTARSKGLSETRVVVRHALRNALIPVVTVLGLQFGALLAGSIITEEIFSWPGIGRALIQAIRTRDFPMIQGCVLLVATTYVAVNTVTDVLYTAVNPRVRLG